MPDAPKLAILPEGRGRVLGDAGLPDLIPSSISRDRKMRAIAAAVELEIRRNLRIIPAVLLWPAINELTEPLLTHLAVMLHADWWDESWTLEAKRKFILRQIRLHRKKGTPWAVEEAVSLVYGRAHVREWYEYGGDRGCFRLEVEVGGFGLTDEAVAKIELMVERYKRKSQHLCDLSFFATSPGTVYIGALCLADELLTVYPYYPTELDVPGVEQFTGAAVDIYEIISINPV